jgi:hypothetical protein
VCTVDSNLEFVALPRVEHVTFDATPLYQLTQDMKEFSLCETKKFDPDGFINFESYFNDCMLLHDDISLPLLVRLKHHLELVQVCLGRIEH